MLFHMASASSCRSPCCGDVEEGRVQENLRDVERRYADVVGLDEVLAYIETAGRRNTNEAP